MHAPFLRPPRVAFAKRALALLAVLFFFVLAGCFLVLDLVGHALLPVGATELTRPLANEHLSISMVGEAPTESPNISLADALVWAAATATAFGLLMGRRRGAFKLHTATAEGYEGQRVSAVGLKLDRLIAYYGMMIFECPWCLKRKSERWSEGWGFEETVDEEDREEEFESVSDVLFACIGLYAPQLTIYISVTGAVGAVAAVLAHFSDWLRSLAGTHSWPQPIDLAQLAVNPAALCDKFHFAPMPFNDLLAKVVLTSFFMDIVFGSKDLDSTKEAPLGLEKILFVVYSFGTLFAAYWSGLHVSFEASSGVISWHMYELCVLLITHQSAVISTLQFVGKLFAETNLIEGAPMRFHEALGWDTSGWEEMGYTEIPRAKLPRGHIPRSKGQLFWIAITLLGIVIVPISFSHIIPIMVAFGIVGVAFPIWGMILLPMRLAVNLPIWQDGGHILDKWIAIGARTHAQIWGVLALLYLTVVLAAYARTALWRIQVMAAGTQDKVNGPYGFSKSVMSIMYSVPLIFLFQSLPTWGIWVYGGKQFELAPFMEFKSRASAPFVHCMVSRSVPKLNQVLAWLGLV